MTDARVSKHILTIWNLCSAAFLESSFSSFFWMEHLSDATLQNDHSEVKSVWPARAAQAGVTHHWKKTTVGHLFHSPAWGVGFIQRADVTNRGWLLSCIIYKIPLVNMQLQRLCTPFCYPQLALRGCDMTPLWFCVNKWEGFADKKTFLTLYFTIVHWFIWMVILYGILLKNVCAIYFCQKIGFLFNTFR